MALNALACLFVAAVLLGAGSTTAMAASRALIVAVDAYADTGLGAPGGTSAANDAEAMRTYLIEQRGFNARQIRLLNDKKAIKAAILESIGKWLAAGTKAGEQAYFYFAGLGFVQKDDDGDEPDGLDETLVPHDARVGDVGAQPRITGMISDDELSKALSALEGREVTVVIDTGHMAPDTPAVPVRTLRLSKGFPDKAAPQPVGALGVARTGFVETSFRRGSIVSWSAARAGQPAFIDTGGKTPRGLFTRLFLEGAAEGKADRNGNDVVSNAELMAFVQTGLELFCADEGNRCADAPEAVLEPVSAFGRVAAGKAPARLTLDRITDILINAGEREAVVEQVPASPVRVGTHDIRYRVTSPRQARLVLLNLTDRGKLIQFYPNQFSVKHEPGPPGVVVADRTVTVPDGYYDLQLTATSPVKGHILAILTSWDTELGEAVNRRGIEVIPTRVALESYLPRLGRMLNGSPRGKRKIVGSGTAGWSLTILPYEVLPRQRQSGAQ